MKEKLWFFKVISSYCVEFKDVRPRDRRVAGSRLRGILEQDTPCIVLVQKRKTGNRSDMKNVELDAMHQLKHLLAVWKRWHGKDRNRDSQNWRDRLKTGHWNSKTVTKHLIAYSSRFHHGEIRIYLGSQIAVGMLTLNWVLGHYLDVITKTYESISSLQRKAWNLEIVWTLGHSNVQANGFADILAKEAAMKVK